jgi:hypothetical protein
MTTPLTIISLDQGKNIYKDWTLEIVDDTPSPAKSQLIKRFAALWLRMRIQNRVSDPVLVSIAVQR